MGRAPDMHEHDQLTDVQYRRMHGYNHGGCGTSSHYHNGEIHQHTPNSIAYKSYGRPRSDADWDVPVRLVVEERNGVVVKLTILPRESDAGYFGGGSRVIDGDTFFDNKEGMWEGIADYLAANQVYGSDDRFFLHWEG